MKEKDLEKNLDNLIIDGLIKEAEQDNADFEAAIRKMREADFNQLVRSGACKSRWKIFRPWISSAIAAAAVILIILVPSINTMNGKLCDSALYASSAYITSSRSANAINSLSDEQLKARLPEFENRYKDCIKRDGKFTSYTDDLKETGWDLTLVYLRLHKKGDAVKVLNVLSEQFKGTPFGEHCKKMLDQL